MANNILFMGLNNNSSCITMATEDGFSIFDADPLTLRYERCFQDRGISIVEMLNKSNIVALVGSNNKYPQNEVRIWDDVRCQDIASLEFSSHIKGVRLLSSNIVVILETKIYIYKFSDLSLIEEINTTSNPQGICAVKMINNTMILASLGDNIGEILIRHSLDHSQIIVAHNNAISKICLNEDGKLLATASDKGTLIRIFHTDTGKQYKEFRRGSTQATIQSMAFSKTALAVSSNHGTIHIFNLDSSVTSLLANVNSYFSTVSSSKQFTIPESKSIVFFTNGEKDRQYIIIIGSSGKYYKYSYRRGYENCYPEVIDSVLERSKRMV